MAKTNGNTKRFLEGKWRQCPLSYYTDRAGRKRSLPMHNCWAGQVQGSPCAFTQAEAAEYVKTQPLYDGRLLRMAA